MNEKESGKNHFDKAAATWDDNPIHVELADSIYEKITEKFPVSKTMSAMEFGCGTGLVSMKLAPMLKLIVAADNSEQMLDALNNKIMKTGYDNVSTYKFNIDQDKFPDTKFDLIFSSMVLHHIKDIKALLLMISQSLNPGGYVAIADVDKEDGSFHQGISGVDVFHFGFDRDEFGKSLEEAGFANITDTTAYVFKKENKEGHLIEYPVFLMTGRKFSK